MSAEGAEATGGEGARLSEAERLTICAELARPASQRRPQILAAVERIVAARVQQAAAERDALRERVEALADAYDAHANRPECNDDEGWRCPECTHARALRATLDG